MAISTNLLGIIARQKRARDRIRTMIEDLREAQSYLFLVGSIKEQVDAGVEEDKLKMPGVWIEWKVRTRDGERHTEQMLFCRTKEHYLEDA